MASWVTPITNRTGPWAKCNWEDMNRICGNANIVWGLSLKEDWNNNDILNYTTWSNLVVAAKAIDSTINFSYTWDNFNKIEAAMWRSRKAFPSNSLYPSELLYPKAST